MAAPPLLGVPAAARRARFVDSLCGRVVAILLIAYGALNTYLYFKFTPVYRATECGDQTAEMDDLELGAEITVKLQIQVVCFNPNGYAVQVMTSEPGLVFVGKNREVVVGTLALVKGSNLPAKSSGAIKVRMNAKLSDETSMSLVPHFLEDPEIPMFLELQFVVSVNIMLLGHHLGTTAPFRKKCGMNMAGVLSNAASRLGPMLCRSSWEELSDLPSPGEASESGKMSFSAAQMDPERIRLGEAAKDVSIIGIGGLCYAVGFALLYGWLMSCIEGLREDPQTMYDQVGPLDGQRRMSCLRSSSGNLVEQIDQTMSTGGSQPSWCLRGSSGNLVEATTSVVESPGMMARASRFVGGFSPYSQAPGDLQATTPFEQEWEGVAWEETYPHAGCSVLQPMLSFMNCGRSSSKKAGRASPPAHFPL